MVADLTHNIKREAVKLSFSEMVKLSFSEMVEVRINWSQLISPLEVSDNSFNQRLLSSLAAYIIELLPTSAYAIVSWDGLFLKTSGLSAITTSEGEDIAISFRFKTSRPESLENDTV